MSKIGKAIKYMRNGDPVKRGVWESNVFLKLEEPSSSSNLTEEYICMEDNGSIFLYVFSHEDILADDWEIHKE